MEERQSAQDYFKAILMTVIGQAYSAAGYELVERPVQWAGGQFRFIRQFESGLYAFIEYQHLAYTDTEWAPRMPSRFRVMLTRSDQQNPGARSTHPRFAQRLLSALVVDDFGVAILPSADHWWTYQNPDQLAHALAEAGHLSVGYGMPWLAGDLTPGQSDSDQDDS